jgi:fructose/tagatose bisphosphate aldolase
MTNEEKNNIRERVSAIIETCLEHDAPALFMTLHEGTLKFAGVNTSAAEMLSMLLTASDAVMDEHSTAGKTLN